MIWGVARTNTALSRVTLHGAGAPRELTLTKQGTFAIVLPASIDPERLTLVVRLADGSVERGRPGEGLTPDPVRSRRPR